MRINYAFILNTIFYNPSDILMEFNFQMFYDHQTKRSENILTKIYSRNMDDVEYHEKSVVFMFVALIWFLSTICLKYLFLTADL